MAKILITGGCGFIGGHLVRGGLARGHEIVVLDDLSTGKRENLADLLVPGSSAPSDGRLRFILGSLNDPAAMAAALQGVEVVLHQAAIPSVPRSVSDPAGTHEANINGTLSLMLHARQAGVRRLVLASSSSVYGDSPVSPKHESLPLAPLSPYAVHKAALELYAAVWPSLYGVDTVCLRYFNVFGPRQDPKSQYAAAIPAFITAILAGKSPTVYGDGEQTRDFTFVENVVQANYLAAFAERKFAGLPINIACGDAISVNLTIATINRILGTSVQPQHDPERPGDIKHSLADVTRAKEVLGFVPAVGFEEGLRRTIAWYKG